MWFAAVCIVWGVGMLALAVWAKAKGRAYLRRLPPVDGVPLDIYMGGGNGWLRGGGPVSRAWRQPQSDPELERLRQEGRRRARFVMLWIFGFPALVAAVMVILILSGALR